MSKKKIYLSGKITGLPFNEVKQKFLQAECFYTLKGYEVINPLSLPHNHDKSWSSYMIECLTALVPCDEVAMLLDWTSSPGAIIERDFAIRMDKRILYIDKF